MTFRMFLLSGDTTAPQGFSADGVRSHHALQAAAGVRVDSLGAILEGSTVTPPRALTGRQGDQ